MTDREALAAAVADRPRDETPRLVFADWLDDHDQPERAAYVRAACAARRARPGSEARAGQLDRADDLLAAHEADWLGPWRDKLIDWTFRGGFLHRVRMTAADFLRDGGDLLRAEPVETVELATEANEPLPADTVREVVAHPTFALVRDCAVMPGSYNRHTPVDAWMTALAATDHAVGLRRFGPVRGGTFQYDMSPSVRSDGIDRAAVEAFARADHLRTLRRLDLSTHGAGYAPPKPWLVPASTGATFAGNLRSLTLDGHGLAADGLRRLAAEPAFARLRSLGLGNTCEAAEGWAAVFNSSHLSGIRTFRVAADRLPLYARSPLARRVRNLTVDCANDLDRDLAADAAAWMELIDAAPPPVELTMNCHNPGPEVFRAMREGRWLRRVRRLDVSGDSQYEVYSGRTAGVRSLFRPGVLPRLTRLRLHEIGDGRTRSALAGWSGLTRLESLTLTDDYHGRLTLTDFDPVHPPERVRTLEGVVVVTDADADRFLGWPRLERLERLKLSFCAEYLGSRSFAARLAPAAAERLVRSGRLDNLTALDLGFHYLPEVQARLAEVLAEPAVLPRLKHLTFYSSFGNQRPPLDGLRARFGRRLSAF